jgi:fibronectin-binding autotransporter adhesin
MAKRIGILNILQGAFMLCVLIGCSMKTQAQSTSWIGGTNTKWTTSSNWTNGVPSSSKHAVIGDANFTGSNQPELNSGTLRCKSLTIGNGTKTSTLKASRSVIIYEDVLIGSNGTINHNSSRNIVVAGDWINNGTYSATNNRARVTFSGANVSLTGTTAFRDLKINAGCRLTLGANISVSSDFDCYGTLNPTANYVVSGTADLDVERNGVIEVYTSTFAGNYTISSVDIDSRGEVNYASSSITQTVSSAYKYGILRISGGSTKELAASLTDLHSGGSTRGRVYVDAGIFDLKGYTCDRSANGGVFVVAADAELWIGGTGDFPDKFSTVTLASTSVINYYGNNQSIKDLDYGHLTLGGTSGSVVKTMPSSTLDIYGDFTIEIGGATDLDVTAKGDINVVKNTLIEADCTLDGDSYDINLNADLENEGILDGATSTYTFTGVGAFISGTGDFYFNNVSFSESGITADGSSYFFVDGNIETTGGGTFSHGAGGAIEMTGTSKTISGFGFTFYDLDVQGSVTTAAYLTIAGDLLVDGSFSATANAITISGSSSVVDGTGSITFHELDITGSVTTAINFTVEDDFSVAITGSFSASAGEITFDGTTNLSGTATLYNLQINATKSLLLASNAHLKIGNAFTNLGTFTTSTYIPNTVSYIKNGAQTVQSETYYNLILAVGGTKTLGNSTTVNNDITINSGVTLNASSFTLTIKRHWNNNGTFTSATSDVQFTGSNAATISGATTFNTFTVNKSSNEVQIVLSNNVTASSIVMTSGYIDTDVNSITTTGSRTGNGIIIGTIIHDHSIADATAYYFEGPYNSLTFYNPSSVNKVTVKVTLGEVANVNPVVESVTREYDVSIPSGTYDSVTARLHYENNELNAFVEPHLAFYEYVSGTTWDSLGYDGRDVTQNYVELDSITDINNVYMLSGRRNVVRWNGTVSSDWSNASNWTTVSGASMANRVPDSLDVARIGDTLFVNQPTISSSEKINVLRFADTKASTITFSGGDLEVIGSARGNWSSNQSHTINVGNDTLVVGTNLKLSDGVSLHDIDLKINGGLANIKYNLEHDISGKVTFSGSGELRIEHDYLYTGGSFTPSIGTVTYSGSVNQDIAPLTYYNLKLDKSSARASINESTNVLNNLTTSTGGELIIFDTVDIDNDFIIGASSEVLEFNAPIMVGGDWTNNGTFSVSGGTVEFDGTSDQNVNANTFNNLKVNKASGVLHLTDNIILGNNITVENGSFDLNTYTANRTAEGGQFSLDSNSNVLLGGSDNFPSNFLTVLIDTHSTVTYDGSVSQNVLPLTYGHLVFSNGSPNTKNLTRSITVLGDLSINTSTVLSPDTSSITLFGDFSNSGTVTPGSSTLILNGSSNTFTGTTSLHNLSVIDGSYTVATGTVTMEGNLYVESTGSLSFGSNTAILDGNLTNYGSLTSNGTATFTGTKVQNISLYTAINSTSTGVINFNGSVAPVISSSSSPNFATVNINNTAGITPSVPWFVIVAMNIDANSSFNAGAMTHTFYGSFDNDGAVYSTGKLLYSPGAPYSASATISLLGDTFSAGEVEFAGTVPITLSGALPNFETVVVSNTHSSGITAPGSWSISNDLQIVNGSIFNAGTSNAHTIGENLVNNGTLNGGTSLITFVGDTVSVDGTGDNNFEDMKVDTNTILALNNDILVYSDLILAGMLETSGSIVEFTGSAAGTISGVSGNDTIDELKTTKDAGVVTTLNIPIVVSTHLNMESGLFSTDATNIIEVIDDATSTAGNDTSFVDGPIRKVGNDSFVFPLGDSSEWARLGISAPSATTDAFTAEYFSADYTDTSTMAVSPTPVLNNVSQIEYWTCDRTTGSSSVMVELYWENKYRSGIDTISSDLVVARWNGSAWENAGRSAAQGDLTGSITSSSVSSFGPFTFGSTTGGINKLPVELLSFSAELNENKAVDITWVTATEINNDYFEVEHSLDAIRFNKIETVQGAGNSTETLYYGTVDYRPNVGVNYYRLKQVDFDGTYAYSDVVLVNLEDRINSIRVYPNPTKDMLTVESSIGGLLSVYDAQMKLVKNVDLVDTLTTIDLDNLGNGIYTVTLVGDDKTHLFKVVKY